MHNSGGSVKTPREVLRGVKYIARSRQRLRVYMVDALGSKYHIMNWPKRIVLEDYYTYRFKIKPESIIFYHEAELKSTIENFRCNDLWNCAMADWPWTIQKTTENNGAIDDTVHQNLSAILLKCFVDTRLHYQPQFLSCHRQSFLRVPYPMHSNAPELNNWNQMDNNLNLECRLDCSRRARQFQCLWSLIKAPPLGSTLCLCIFWPL